MGEQLEPVCFFASTAALVRVGLLTKVEWVQNLYKVVYTVAHHRKLEEIYNLGTILTQEE